MVTIGTTRLCYSLMLLTFTFSSHPVLIELQNKDSLLNLLISSLKVHITLSTVKKKTIFCEEITRLIYYFPIRESSFFVSASVFGSPILPLSKTTIEW